MTIYGVVASEAADSMKVTALDLKDLGIADKIMTEPLGGTHQNYDKAALTLKNQIIHSLSSLKNVTSNKLIENKINKYQKMGKWING